MSLAPAPELLPSSTFSLLLNGDCVEIMRQMAEASVDAIVCDPPYELGFMGKKWDGKGGVATDPATWIAALRVLKPGGYLLAFGGTRTYHRLACAVEDAGFEIRDSLAWLHGQGFPKSRNIPKDLDKVLGETRAVVGTQKAPGLARMNVEQGDQGRTTLTFPKYDTAGISEAAKTYEGYGTALKPAMEPVVVARKPMSLTIAENVLRHGTGALNIDGCRVPMNGETVHAVRSDPGKRGGVVGTDLGFTLNDAGTFQAAQAAIIGRTNALGRWPANVVHDGSDEVIAAFPVTQSGDGKSGSKVYENECGQIVALLGKTKNIAHTCMNDSGSAARFFYCAKASRSEREAGCGDLPDTILARSEGAQAAERAGSETYTGGSQDIGLNRVSKVKNNHPTIKPVALMRWLIRLVTPPGGVVLDPFTGSGTTGVAALAEGFDFIGIEREADYVTIAEARLRGAGGSPEVA